MSKNQALRKGLFVTPVVLALLGCTTGSTPQTTASAPATGGATLKDAFKNDFVIGVALNNAEFDERDKGADAVVLKHFNCISPENTQKWEVVNPKPGVWDFTESDHYVEFGEKHHMRIIGHNLLWHQQVPKWVFEDDKGGPITRDALLARLKDHIFTLAGRYKGRVFGWDVVNEVVGDDGKMRQTPWLKIIGDDYIAKAFEYAHEAAPDAELYYNDYNLEYPNKRAMALELVKKLKAQGVPITGVGIQAHLHLDTPTLQEEEDTIEAFSKLGVKVMITELDIDVLPGKGNATADVSVKLAEDPKLNPYVKGLPDDMQQALAKHYADLFKIYVKHKGEVTRVTFWNVNDGDSWLNGFPIPGRTNHPLLFDRNNNPKPALAAVLKVGQQQ